MVKIATRYDKAEIKALMRQFRDESGFDELSRIDDSYHFDAMLESIFVGQGVIYLEEGKGLLMALILPTIWDSKTLVMHELAWYVKPEFRKGSIGYRLFKMYVDYGNQLKREGRIAYFTMSKLDTSPNLKYDKHGFRKKDENWVQ